jgi:hypothetical protein
MKPKILLITIAFFVVAISVSNAQNPITTLQHAGSTQVFYGQNSFVDAYNISVDGDTLLLSVGAFNVPTNGLINRNLTIIGASYLNDETSIKKRTTILSTLYIIEPAKGAHLEGLFINKDIECNILSPNEGFELIRCQLNDLYIRDTTHLTINNIVKDCIITGKISGNNFQLRNSIIGGRITNTNATISNNIILIPYLEYVSNSIIQNNIILGREYPSLPCMYSCNNNVFYNNVFVDNTIGIGAESSGNYGSNNYLGIPQTDIFINPIGISFDYSYDYHLKNPELYIGTDGTQVGLYGGIIPFKDGGLPSNPQIISKSVANQTDASGNLNINFTVKAQEN